MRCKCRTGFENMVGEADREEMEKRWAAENERIMREHASTDEAAIAAPVEQGEAAPVMVERPVVLPASEDHPAPKPDGAAS